MLQEPNPLPPLAPQLARTPEELLAALGRTAAAQALHYLLSSDDLALAMLLTSDATQASLFIAMHV